MNLIKIKFVRMQGLCRLFCRHLSTNGRPIFDASRQLRRLIVAQFLGTDASGNKIMIAGIGPMKMLLMAVGGCAAVDLVSILKKQRQAVEGVQIKVEGQRTTDHPRPFDKIHATFEVSGSNLDPVKVQRAVDLSIEKYCGVHASLTHGVPVTWGSEVVESRTL
ncbi:OsmC/Ohr family [Chytridium lagenaria]|nr:OsmC/Ohr family [Chytridium lagenaria]